MLFVSKPVVFKNCKVGMRRSGLKSCRCLGFLVIDHRRSSQQAINLMMMMILSLLTIGLNGTGELEANQKNLLFNLLVHPFKDPVPHVVCFSVICLEIRLVNSTKRLQ